MSQPQAAPHEHYHNRGNAAYLRLLARRTATERVPFFLQQLTPGTRVLDAGCGPGSITLGLAEAVAPDGEAVGVDVDGDALAMARGLATERGVTNVRFEEGSIYALPFADGSFDAASAFAVLIHMSDPVAALRELHRVLRPGGVIGVVDPDTGGTMLYPMTPLLRRWRELAGRNAQAAGTHREFGRQHRELLLAAGFRDPEANAMVQAFGTPRGARVRAEVLVTRFRGPDNAAGMALREGWATEAEVEAICTALAWKPA